MYYILFAAIIGIFLMLVSYFRFSFNMERFYKEGQAKFRNRDFAGAVNDFRKVLSIDPLNIDSNLYLVSIYKHQNKIPDAEKIYHKLLELSHPENNRNKVAIFFNLGELFWKNRFFDRAYLEFRKVLELDGTESRVHFFIGVFFAGQGMLPEAIESLKKAVEIDPDYKEARLYLGLCYCSRNWWVEAKREFGRILEADPEYMRARLFLGYLLKDDRNPAAINEFDYVISRGKGEIRYRAVNLSGITAIEQGYYEKASAIYEKALEEAGVPENWMKEFRYNLGWSYMFDGNSSRAVEEWNEIANLDINFYNVADLIRSFEEVDMEAMEDEWRIYSMNETIPNVETYIGHPGRYNVDLLNKQFDDWRHEHQEMLNIRFARGLVRSSSKLARINAAAFKKMGRKIVNYLKLFIEEEKVRAAGINYYTYANAENKPKVVVFFRNWENQTGEDQIQELIEEVNRLKASMGIFLSCGSFSKNARALAKASRIRLMGNKALDKLLEEL